MVKTISVNELVDKAFDLCGYTRTNELNKQAIIAADIIVSDIFYTLHKEGYSPITKLDDEIFFEERIINDILPYGVAAKIAELEYDGEKQNIFAAYYNRKRLSLGGKTMIEDKLPRGDW